MIVNEQRPLRADPSTLAGQAIDGRVGFTKPYLTRVDNIDEQIDGNELSPLSPLVHIVGQYRYDPPGVRKRPSAVDHFRMERGFGERVEVIRGETQARMIGRKDLDELGLHHFQKVLQPC